jgi:cell division protein FtsZ
MAEAYNIIENDEFFENAKIKVIGVGGGGGNMLNYMVENGVSDIELIAANTDAQALKVSKAPMLLQLGTKLTKGLGAGMKPEVGKQAAEENIEDIKKHISDADLVFISAGMGGGTGTGAASVIARISKEMGALTVGVVTTPFSFEGRKREKLAKIGYEELKKECDSIVTIPNNKLLTIIDKKAGRKEAFKKVDEVLHQAVTGISKTIISYSENDINVDFADLTTVMSHRGQALMSAGHSVGENSAYNAVKQAIESPLLDNLSIDNAMGVLVHFESHEDYPFVEHEEAMNIFHDSVHEDADIFYGTTTNNELAVDEINVTIVVTGFEQKKEANNVISNEEKDSNSNIFSNKLPKSPIRKIVGGEGLELSGEEIDIPTYMRVSRD